jgi:hypothetical protein
MNAIDKTFYVPGDPVGFKAGPRNHITTSKIASYAEKVRLFASLQAGFKLPLTSERLYPMLLHTIIAFGSGKNHPDAENVHKLIKDILFYHGKTYVDKTGALCVRKHGYGNDRYTWGSYEYCYQSKPGVIVIIKMNTLQMQDRQRDMPAELQRYGEKAHG